MNPTRREALTTFAGAAALSAAQVPSGPAKYVRYRNGSAIAYGLLDGDTVREIRGDLFGAHKLSGTKHKLSEVKLLHPCTPPKVLAVGLNYRSHLGDRKPPSRPEMFYKPITSLQNPDDPIVIPKDSKNLHYEGELVLVIGKAISSGTEEQARAAIFGVTCGNDVSERDWQNGSDKDLQWWRAKGADTFAPLGPWIATGITFDKLLLHTRLNGEVVQKQYTSDLIYGPAEIVRFVSHYVALTPGDVIYTGTPGSTRKMNPGDTVEVEISGVGVLRNKVVQG